MAGVFISFAHQDEKDAKRLALRLEKTGIDSFMSRLSIKGGDDWENELVDAMQRCDVLLIYGTRRWLNSKWCRAEFLAARLAKKNVLIADTTRKGFQEDPSLTRIQTEPFLAKNESRIQAILARLQTLADADTLYPFDPKRLPYPGLQALDVSDAGIFFGRKAETEMVLGEIAEASLNAAAAKFLVMYGPSGSGKSSVLRAGVIARLKRQDHMWDVLGPVIPGEDPLGTLASVHEKAREKAESYQSFVGKGRKKTKRPSKWILVTIDQFEEVFQQAEHVAAFSKLLVETIRLPGVLVVCTIRSDFMPFFQQLNAFVGLWKGLPIDRFDIRKLREIVARPAARVGFTVDDALIEALECDANTPDALPLVAFALSEVWRRAQVRDDRKLTLADYTDGLQPEVGTNRLERILVERAEAALIATDPKDEHVEDLLEAFIPNLVDVRDSGEPVRRRSVMSAFSEPAQEMLDLLSGPEWRLITADVNKDGERTFEVAHEALLRRWPLLSQAIGEETSNLSLIRNIEREALEYDNAGSEHDYLLRLSGQRLIDALNLTRSRSYSGRVANVSRYIAKCEQLERRRFDEAQALKREKTDSHDRSIQQEIKALGEKGVWSEAIRMGQRALSGTTDALIRTEAQLASQIARSRITRSLRVGYFGLCAIGLAKQSGLLVVAGADGRLRGFDLERACVVWESEPLSYWAIAIDICQRTNRVVAGLVNGEVVVLDLRNGEMAHRRRIGNGPVSAIRFHPSSERVVCAFRNGFVTILSSMQLDDGQAIGRHLDCVTGLTFNPDGSLLVTAGRDQTIELHAGTDYSQRIAINVANAPVLGARFDRTGQRFAAWASDGAGFILDNSGKLMARLQSERLKSAMTALSFAPEGGRVVSGHADGTVALWNSSNQALTQLWRTSEGRIRNVDFTNGSEEIVSVATDGRLVSVKVGEDLPNYELQLGAPAIEMVVQAEESQVIAADADGHITVLDFSRRTTKSFSLNNVIVTSRSTLPSLLLEAADEVLYGPNASAERAEAQLRTWYEVWPMLHSAGSGTFVEAHDSVLLLGESEQKTVRQVELHPRLGPVMACDPDGPNFSVRVLTTAGVVLELDRPTLALNNQCQLPETADIACFVPGRRTILVSSGAADLLREWDHEKNEVRKEYQFQAGRITQVSVSSDGLRAAVATNQSRIFLLGLSATHGRVVELQELHSVAGPISFSPTGGHIAFAISPNSVRILETARLKGGIQIDMDSDNLIRRIVWAPDSRTFAILMKNGNLRLVRKRKRGWSRIDVRRLRGNHIRHLTWSSDSAELLVTTEQTVQTVDAENGSVTATYETGNRCIGAIHLENGTIFRWSKSGSVKQLRPELSPNPEWKKTNKGVLLVKTERAPANTEEKVTFVSGQKRISVKLPSGEVLLAHTGERIASGNNPHAGAYWVESPDRTLHLGRMKDGHLTSAVIKGRSGVEIAKFSPNGQLVAMAFTSGSVEIFDTDTGVSLNFVPKRITEVMGIRFSELSDALMIIYADRMITCIETDLIGRRGEALRELLQTACITSVLAPSLVGMATQSERETDAGV